MILDVLAAVHSAVNPGTEPYSQRTFHPKSTACVAANVEVSGDLPAEFAQGVFQAGRRYDAVVRFSNGTPLLGGGGQPITQQADRLKDLLLTRDDGYLLDPRARVRRVDEP